MISVSDAQAIVPALIALRHELHACPELGNREFETAGRIERFLDAEGIAHRRLLDTAVVARVEGALPGGCCAFRADMDALPIEEATGADFCSARPGIMHACGHDIHMSAAVGAATLLQRHREKLRGTVIFLFQPDEEGNGGAERLLAVGAMEGASAVFGAHVSPELPAGDVGVRYGKFYAASDTFSITVTGKSAHGAEREKGVDALLCAAELVPRLIALPEKLPGERAVVTVGTFSSGTAGNILPDTAQLSGIIRSLGPGARSQLKALLREEVQRRAEQSGTKIALNLRESYPGVVNDDDMTQHVERAAKALLGEKRVHVLDTPTMTTEDFGYLSAAVPGAYYHIGAGCAEPLHNPRFLPEDGILPIAAAVHASVLEEYLQNIPCQE